MDNLLTGKRFFSIGKNLDSDQTPLMRGSHSRYASFNMLPAITKEVGIGKYIEELKNQISEKDEKINQLEKILQSPLKSKLENNSYPALSSYLSPEQRLNKGQELLKDLDKQVESKAKIRLQSLLDKEKELKLSMENLKSQRLSQMHQQLLNNKKSEDYRKELLVQQQMKNQINEALLIDQQFLQPLVHYRNFKSCRDLPQYSPKLNSDELLPKRKNLNPLPANYSNLPAFKQPSYTKHHPKFQKSYPIIGSNYSSYFY